jgi:hypothetical protein
MIRARRTCPHGRDVEVVQLDRSAAWTRPEGVDPVRSGHTGAQRPTPTMGAQAAQGKRVRRGVGRCFGGREGSRRWLRRRFGVPAAAGSGYGRIRGERAAAHSQILLLKPSAVAFSETARRV